MQLAQKEVELHDTISNYEKQLEEEKKNVSTVIVETETKATTEMEYLQQAMDTQVAEIEKYPLDLSVDNVKLTLDWFHNSLLNVHTAREGAPIRGLINKQF